MPEGDTSLRQDGVEDQESAPMDEPEAQAESTALIPITDMELVGLDTIKEVAPRKISAQELKEEAQKYAASDWLSDLMVDYNRHLQACEALRNESAIHGLSSYTQQITVNTKLQQRLQALNRAGNPQWEVMSKKLPLTLEKLKYVSTDFDFLTSCFSPVALERQRERDRMRFCEAVVRGLAIEDEDKLADEVLYLNKMTLRAGSLIRPMLGRVADHLGYRKSRDDNQQFLAGVLNYLLTRQQWWEDREYTKDPS